MQATYSTYVDLQNEYSFIISSNTNLQYKVNKTQFKHSITFIKLSNIFHTLRRITSRVSINKPISQCTPHLTIHKCCLSFPNIITTVGTGAPFKLVDFWGLMCL